MLDILAMAAAVLGIAILGVLVLAALKPTTFHIERSLVINAPADKVFPLISNLRTMNSWNPFANSDPTIKIDYNGPESGTGATFDWDSKGRAGKGRMEITGATPQSSIDMSLVMQKPFACNNQVRFSLAPNGPGTTVTWAMSGPWPYLHRIMGTIFNTDKMVGGEFEMGLVGMKSFAETSRTSIAPVASRI